MLWVDDLLSFEIDCIIIFCFYNLLGVKGVGEVGCIGLMLVVVNVVIDVFWKGGYEVKDLLMFFILEWVWKVMQ